jgi:hypothetical protein
MFDEYRSPGYWLTEEERVENGMCPRCGEYLEPEQICNCLED